jgi:hypothetical protein
VKDSVSIRSDAARRRRAPRIIFHQQPTVNKIYADPTTMFFDTWNASYGNKLTHVLFLVNLCERHARVPVMYQGSVLDRVFEWGGLVMEAPDAAPAIEIAYDEGQPFAKAGSLYSLLGLEKRIPERNLAAVLGNYYRLHLEQTALLSRAQFPGAVNVRIKGWFFDYGLMPSLETFDKAMRPRRELIEFVERKYPSLRGPRSVAVHLRATDFQYHLRNVFPEGIVLDDHYYREAMRCVEDRMGSDVEYHLFSDDMPRLQRLFEGKRCVPHDDPAPMDWVAMFLTRNIIQSNSSFCWTAALYNKSLSIQPSGGYNYHCGIGSVPYGFAHRGAVLIESSRASQRAACYFPRASFAAPGPVDVIGRYTGAMLGAAGRLLRRAGPLKRGA